MNGNGDADAGVPCLHGIFRKSLFIPKHGKPG
jgi:hypothetical protein